MNFDVDRWARGGLRVVQMWFVEFIYIVDHPKKSAKVVLLTPDRRMPVLFDDSLTIVNYTGKQIALRQG